MKVRGFQRAYDELARLLQEERRRAGLTQAAVAARLGKPQSFIAKIERGERQLDLIEFLLLVDAIATDAAPLIEAVRRRVRRSR